MPLDYTKPIRVKGTHEKVEILRTDLQAPNSILAVITSRDGSVLGGAYRRDHPAWENVHAPKRTGTVWVNVYEEYASVAHLNRESADIVAGVRARLACVEVHWTEGEGL